MKHPDAGYRDFYLRADSEAELDAVLLDLGILELTPAPTGPEDQARGVAMAMVPTPVEDVWLDRIGTLYEDPVQTGTAKDGTPIYAPRVPLAGYHANLRLLYAEDATHELVAALGKYRLPPPATPKVEWAGGMTPHETPSEKAARIARAPVLPTMEVKGG